MSSRRPWALVVATLLAAAALAPAGADAAVRATQLGTFSQPVYVTAPPEDPHRLFVLEKEGYVRVMRDGVKLGDPFLDVHTDVISGGEQGLLSMAFAPDYRTSGKFYVYYTTPSPQGNNDIIVDEFKRSADPDKADPATRRRLLTIPHNAASNHNGGQLMFDREGLLYIATGDGGSGNDPPNNAQNKNVLLGKLLRIDPRDGDPYAIPEGNPFAAPGDGARDEIYAYGLRNPFRASFDRMTGDLTIADVGQNRAEEINFSPRGTDAGANYGWRCFEGFQRTTNSCDASMTAGHVEPVLEQARPTGFCAIIGGYVVRDPALTELNGRYVYGDNCQPQMRSAVLQKPRATDDRPVGLSIEGLVSFGEDSCGHVYASSLRGPVYRLDGDGPPTPCPEPGPAPDTAAPALAVSRARSQRALRQKGFVVAVKCGEACGFTASGTMRLSGSKKRYGLRQVSRLANAGQRVRVRLAMSRKATLALRRTLAKRRRATATVTVVARDAAGNQSRRKASIRARR